MPKSYSEQCYERDKQIIGRLCAGFVVSTAILWPLSFSLSGYGLTGEASWWNATAAVSWLAAALTSVGFAITLAIRATITPPIEGSNR